MGIINQRSITGGYHLAGSRNLGFRPKKTYGFAIEILGSSQSWIAVNVSDDKSHHTFLSFLGLDGGLQLVSDWVYNPLGNGTINFCDLLTEVILTTNTEWDDPNILLINPNETTQAWSSKIGSLNQKVYHK